MKTSNFLKGKEIVEKIEILSSAKKAVMLATTPGESIVWANVNVKAGRQEAGFYERTISKDMQSFDPKLRGKVNDIIIDAIHSLNTVIEDEISLLKKEFEEL